nr:hypothetical protein [Tanacetum cinerariifolium]
MIAFLTKSDASEGFDQIVNFLNAHMIQYALMVNPTIYVSCIKQFWTSVSIKTSNDVVRLQSLIDRMKVIITEDTIRQSLRLDDADGVDCLPNEEIFAELARMGYEKLMVRNMDSSSKFLIYLRILQLMINAQVDDLSAHNTKYTSPALTQKQQVQAIEDAAEDEDDDNEVSAEPTPPSPTPATPSPTLTQKHILSPPPSQPSQTTDISMTLLNTLLETCATLTKQRLEKKRQFKSSGLMRLRKVGTAQMVESSTDTIIDDQKEASNQGGGITELDANEDVTLEEVNAKVAMDADVQGRLPESQAKEEVIKVVNAAKLMTEVVTTAATTITTTQVPKATAPRIRKGVVIQYPEETATTSVIMHSKVKSKDKGKGILNEEPKPLKRQAQIEQDKSFAREFKMDFFKGITYNDIRPIFEKHYNLNHALLEIVKEEVIGQKDKGNKRKGDSLNQDAGKKQRIDEETNELQTHLHIVANDDDDDVYIEATPLALKEGIHYSLLHSTSSIPYPICTKIIIGHYMTNFSEILRCARDKYHNLKDDDLMKNIFNSGRYKDKVRIKIPDWMISEEMKQTEHYRMYAKVFGIDVSLIQSPPTESTQGTHRTPSDPRSPTPKVDAKHVVDDSSIHRNDKHNIPGTRLEPKSDKENPEVGITDVIVYVNVYDEEEEDDEIIDEVYELKRRKKGKNVEESSITPFPTPIRSPRIHTDLELQGRYGYLFKHLRAKFMPRKSFVTLDDHLHKAMADSLPTMVDKHIKEQKIKEEMEKMIARAILQEHQDDPHDDAHPEGEKSATQQKTSEYETYVSGVSSSGHDNEHEQGPSTLGPEKIVLSLHKFPTVVFNDDNIEEQTSRWRDPEALALSLINQDLLYLKKGNSGPEKIVLSLHKFPTVVFNDDNIEERTSRWVNKCIKKFNPYARYGVEHWKNPHAKILYIRKQKEPGNQRKANDYIMSIIEPDFKNLNKNDIEDMYLLIMNEKVNLTEPTISFPKVEKHEIFSIIYEPVHGIIYKNSKKEKRVMRHLYIHKFCDATLNRVLEGLKSYNNDVRYGYNKKDQTNDEVEYLKLFEEEIEDRLKYRRQMR